MCTDFAFLGRRRTRQLACFSLLTLFATLAPAAPARRAQEILMPRIAGAWWQVAGDPDLGALGDPKQQPVDFGVWRAADGTWQLWSCIRHTREPGHTRLFYRWEGRDITAPDWKPAGVAMHSLPQFGETPGGLQAPYVFKNDDFYVMVYGNWDAICLATSSDGKAFQRRLNAQNQTALFGEGPGTNTRDPMVTRIGKLWHCYYTAYPGKKGSVYCRTTLDFKTWSPARVVAFGGQAGTGSYAAECPFVVEVRSGQFYLFRTQRYGAQAQTSVYHSADPMDFGIDNDAEHFVCTLPVAAPEIIAHEGNQYIAALLPSLKGIQIARLEWVPRKQSLPKQKE